MVEIKKVGDGVKRLCAVLVACVVMWYSVITAPVFRVGAIDQGSGIGVIATTFVSGLMGLATSTLGGVVGAALGLSLPLVTVAAQESVNPDVAPPVQLPKLLPSISYIGYYVNSSNPDPIRQVTVYGYSWDYTGLNTSYGVGADTIVACEDYTIGCTAAPSEDWLSSSSRENMSIQLGVVTHYGSGSNWVAPSVSLSDSSGVTPVVDLTFWVHFSDGGSFFRTLTVSGNSYSRVRFVCLNKSSNYFSFNRDTFQSYFNDTIGSSTPSYDVNLYVGNNPGSAGQGQIAPSSYPPLTSPITTSEQAINYYDNSVRPYVINNYSSTYPEITQQFVTYQEYYDTLDPAPSETTTPGTGVIIIDPFTLPPEWVESDVVELATDHYEVPFESMVADPFDYLVSPYTQTSTETVRGAMKTVPISPPTPQYQVFPSSGNVQETAVGFVNLAYTLLNRSGLDYVIGIAVFGLCVSLLVL